MSLLFFVCFVALLKNTQSIDSNIHTYYLFWRTLPGRNCIHTAELSTHARSGAVALNSTLQNRRSFFSFPLRKGRTRPEWSGKRHDIRLYICKCACTYKVSLCPVLFRVDTKNVSFLADAKNVAFWTQKFPPILREYAPRRLPFFLSSPPSISGPDFKAVCSRRMASWSMA